MSWWDRYLAPGDIRNQRRHHLQEQFPHPPPSSPRDAEPVPPASRASPQDSPIGPRFTHRADPTTRARRQNALLFGGIAFTGLSLFVTRRALVRKHKATYANVFRDARAAEKPEVPTFTPSNLAPTAEGGFDAVQALFLATLNVASVFMLATGAFVTYADIGDVEDLRDFVRAGVGFDVYAGDSEADKEFEVWMGEVLARKEGLGDFQKTIVEKMSELAEMDKDKEEKKTSVAVAELQR